MPTPFFSVVIPVLNRERELRRALDSCLAQTGADFEVIVVDDGSTDASAGVAAEYAARGVRLIRHKINLGSSPARTNGMRAARGEWVVRLDSDDELAEGALATAAEHASRATKQVGRIGLMYRYDDGRVSPFPKPKGGVLDYEGMLRFLESSALLDFLHIYRRSAIQAVPLRQGRLMEVIHNLDFSRRYDSLLRPEIGVLYHLDAGRRQSRSQPDANDARQFVDEICQIQARHGEALRRLAPGFYRQQLRIRSVCLALTGARFEAIRDAARNLKAAPQIPLNWAALLSVSMGPRSLRLALEMKWRLVQKHRQRICGTA